MQIPGNCFEDLSGRRWSVDLNVWLCRRVKELHGVDLANWQNGDAQKRLWLDDAVLVAVLWVLIEDQAAKIPIDEEQFARALNGDVLASGLAAIQEAEVGFTRPDRRELIRQVNAEATQIQAKLVSRAGTLVSGETTRRAMDQKIEDEMLRIQEELAEKLSTLGT